MLIRPGKTQARRSRIGVVITGVLLLSGCALLGFKPSPTTTYTDESGNEVTVEWVNYPANAGVDGEALIGYPDQAEIEPAARELVEQLRAAITESSGFELDSSEPEQDWFDSDHWFPQQGNGYGGDSMLVTVNCCEMASDGVPTPHKWQSVLDAASQVAENAGLGRFVVEEIPDYCDAEGKQCWLWAARATNGVQWVSLTIQDHSLDPTGDAVREAEKYGWPIASVGFEYGATVVVAGGKDDFARAMVPFVGLRMPAATSSN